MPVLRVLMHVYMWFNQHCLHCNHEQLNVYWNSTCCFGRVIRAIVAVVAVVKWTEQKKEYVCAHCLNSNIYYMYIKWWRRNEKTNPPPPPPPSSDFIYNKEPLLQAHIILLWTLSPPSPSSPSSSLSQNGFLAFGFHKLVLILLYFSCPVCYFHQYFSFSRFDHSRRSVRTSDNYACVRVCARVIATWN